MGRTIIPDDTDEKVLFYYNELAKSFWKNFFFAFYMVYKKIITIGSLILAICLVVLYIQAKYPYQYKQKETVQEEEENVEEDVQPDTQTESQENDTALSERDFKNKYIDYKVKYKGKKGVGKKKAEQILEKYLYYEWDSGIVIMPKIITFTDSSSSLYKVIHVRKISNKKIVAYLEFASENDKISTKKFTVKEKNDMYWMNYDG